VAGEMLVSETVLAPVFEARHYLHYVVPVACALLVLGLGRWLAIKSASANVAVDLLDAKVAGKNSEQ
jgi:hypothetical protein